MFAMHCGNILLCTIYIWDTVIEMFCFWLLRYVEIVFLYFWSTRTWSEVIFEGNMRDKCFFFYFMEKKRQGCNFASVCSMQAVAPFRGYHERRLV